MSREERLGCMGRASATWHQLQCHVTAVVVFGGKRDSYRFIYRQTCGRVLETTAGRIARQLLAAAPNKRVAAVIFRDTLLVTTNQIVIQSSDMGHRRLRLSQSSAD
jgi:hypothetical protein